MLSFCFDFSWARWWGVVGKSLDCGLWVWLPLSVGGKTDPPQIAMEDDFRKSVFVSTSGQRRCFSSWTVPLRALSAERLALSPLPGDFSSVPRSPFVMVFPYSMAGPSFQAAVGRGREEGILL